MYARERLTDDGLVIFLFHGVADGRHYEVRNYTRKHLEPDYFRRFLLLLKGTGRALSLAEVVELCQAGAPFPPKSFAITFDDGFENNYSIAAPILSDLDLPATFYVSTQFIQDNAMSWIDRIEYCLERTPCGTLRLPWDQEQYTFRSAADKIHLLGLVRQHVKHDASVQVDELAADVFRQCRLPEVSRSSEAIDAKMSWRQVAALHRDPLFTVGGHSHHHVVLSFLEPAEMEAEIQLSLQLLQARSGVPPGHYSYPEGLQHCYSVEVIDTLRRFGVVCCPTAMQGVNMAGADLFHLRRIAVT